MTTTTNDTLTLYVASMRITELERERDALLAEHEKTKARVTPCMFHDDNYDECIAYSGQAPCQAEGDTE